MRTLLQVAVVVMATAVSARAVAFAFSTGLPATIAVAPGATVQVPIYLSEAGSPPRIAAEGGLFSAGFAVRRSGIIPADPTTILNASSNPSAFDDIFASFIGPAGAGVWEQQNGDLFGSGASPIDGWLLLGSVGLKASTSAGQVTNFTIGDYAAASGQFATYDGTESLDASIASAGFSIATTPEPACLAAAVISIAFMSSRRRSRRPR